MPVSSSLELCCLSTVLPPRRRCKWPTFPLIVLAAIFLGCGSVVATPANAQGMMAVCEAAIDSYCGAVSRGRGRITACLYAHGDKLTISCRGEVNSVAGSTISKGIGKLATAESETNYRAACSADTTRLCSNVTDGDGRILACLYSRSDNASYECNTAVKQFLN